jgi:hypothetical protein
MGLVNFLFEMFNQAGVPVMTLTTTSMFGRRTQGAAQAAVTPAELT